MDQERFWGIAATMRDGDVLVCIIDGADMIAARMRDLG